MLSDWQRFTSASSRCCWGYVGIVFCGFALEFWRGIRNIIVPFVAFGDAYNQFPRLLWLWGGGVALIALGALLVR